MLLLLVLVSLEGEELFWYLGDRERLGVGEVDRVCWCGWSNEGEEEGVEEGLTPTNRGGITGGTCYIYEEDDLFSKTRSYIIIMIRLRVVG